MWVKSTAACWSASEVIGPLAHWATEAKCHNRAVAIRSDLRALESLLNHLDGAVVQRSGMMRFSDRRAPRD
jgi:hypothetical protein